MPWIKKRKKRFFTTMVFTEAKDDGSSGNSWSHIQRRSCKASVKSLPPTNQQQVFFTARMPFPSPNQQFQSTEGEKYHILWTCLPQTHLGSSNLSLTTNSSWLPWGRVAMPLVSPKSISLLWVITFLPPPRKVIRSRHLELCCWQTNKHTKAKT